MIQQRQKILVLNLVFIDLFLIVASFFAAYGLRSLFEIEGRVLMGVSTYTWLLWLMLPLWGVLLWAFGLYSPRFLRLRDQLVQLSKAIGLAWLVMAAILFLSDQQAQGYTNRLVALFTLVLSYAALASARVALFAAASRGRSWVRHVAIIGDSSSASDVARTIKRHGEWGLKPIGVFPEERAREVLERGGVDEMIFVVDRQRLDSYEDIFLSCEELGVTVRVVLNLFPSSVARMELHELDGFPLLTFSTTPSDETLLFLRRVMDIALSALLLLVLSPVAMAAALAIKLTSPGPVLFRQLRLGLHGRPFTMYKFRSMSHDAEGRRAGLDAINEMDGPVFKSSRDPRVTIVGRLLRRFSIDELPQLYNVFTGDMSLVGPRPPLPAEVARYERWQRRRLSMKPGITCLWQISGRNQLGFDEWMRLDLSYIDNWSLLLDLKILLKTVPVVLLGKGAR